MQIKVSETYLLPCGHVQTKAIKYECNAILRNPSIGFTIFQLEFPGILKIPCKNWISKCFEWF